MKTVIFAGAEVEDYGYYKKWLENAVLFICCDSGLRHAKHLNIMPDFILGDFDSVDKETLDYYKEKHIDTIVFPTHKDETDLVLGLDKAIEKGATDITVIGAIGNRLDHTLASCHYLLYLLKKGITARLVNERNEVFVIDKECLLIGEKGDIISTIPLSMEVKGITTYNLEYPLFKKDLTIDDRLIAVSNVMCGEEARITIEGGYLFVMKCKD